MAHQYLNQQKTFTGDAVLTSNYYDDAVVAGMGYTLETVFTLASNATVYLEVNPKALSGKRFTVLPTGWGISASYAKVTLGTCASCSGGSTLTFLNRNYYYLTSRPAGTTLRINAVPTTPTDSPISFIIGTEAAGKELGGGTLQTGGIQILDPTLDYYFKVVNQGDIDALVSVNIKIYETPIDTIFGY